MAAKVKRDILDRHATKVCCGSTYIIEGLIRVQLRSNQNFMQGDENMRKRFWTNMISAFVLSATTLAAAGCGALTTLPMESTQPVVDGTEKVTQISEPKNTTEPTVLEGTTVSQQGPYGTVSLTIPEGWAYRTCPVGDDALINGNYGIQFYPEGKEGCVEVAYSDAFGVCGTGLEDKHETVAGADANVGYYDGSNIWWYVVFHGANENIYAMTTTVDEWWNLRAPAEKTDVTAEKTDVTNEKTDASDEKTDASNKQMASLTYGQQVMRILDSVKFDPDEQSGAIGIINEERANDKIGVTTSIKKVSATGATVEFYRIEPTVEGEIITGEYFSVEKKNGDKWEAVEQKRDDIAFKDIAYAISLEDSFRHDYDWSLLYGELTPGEYRINLEVCAEGEKYTLSPQFLVR